MSPRFPESLEVHGHEGVTGRVLVSGAPAVSLGAVRAHERGAAGRGACLALVLARPCLPGGAGGSGLSAPPPHPPRVALCGPTPRLPPVCSLCLCFLFCFTFETRFVSEIVLSASFCLASCGLTPSRSVHVVARFRFCPAAEPRPLCAPSVFLTLLLTPQRSRGSRPCVGDAAGSPGVLALPQRLWRARLRSRPALGLCLLSWLND